ncbi:plastocyanin/azurin family copper-binding protein [Haloferax prahovense]|uniref:plastocyanin/azurin family copper-binding protein n=1 Tax=Haloferax TaxID=2251 RepID=UPI0005B1D45E|nr:MULTISPECIES: plastocyanin/azurin family copper-binding protein [unclassified Haloferax]
MTKQTDTDDLELSDDELIEVIKNHGIDRRSLLKVFGVGAAVSALGGTAAATSGRGNRIDEVYGAPYSADDTVPSGLVDHVVELHTHEENIHDDFPIDPESGNEVPAEFIFDPVGLHVRPGEVVEFRVHHGLHTVTSFHPKFSEPPVFTLPSRVPTSHGFTSPPVVGGDSWLYRFTKQGVYDVLCLPHLTLGMVARIVVSGDGAVPSDTYGPLPIPNAGAVLGAPEMTPENIVSEGSVAWEDLTL